MGRLTGTDVLMGTDSYKMGHGLMYPPGTTHIISYYESRGGGFSSGNHTFNDILFFGLQYWLKEYLSVQITQKDVQYASKFAAEHGEPFDDGMWLKVALHNNGRLPLKIRALPEGTLTKPGLPLFTVENTVPGMMGLVSYIETELTHVWQPITVASYSYALRRVLEVYFERTGTEDGTLYFRVHDFGGRGASSRESAMLGGMGHLAAGWMGTDTVAAVEGARRYYGTHMAGYSVAATEHSVMTAWGEDREEEAYRRMIESMGGPGKIVSIVSDTYDLYHVLQETMPAIKPAAEATGSIPVVRLDSGEPLVTVLNALELLADSYGVTTNDKGFKVLDGVRILQGDGINLHTVDSILERMMVNGWSVDNIVFGIGGALLQRHDRDEFKFAFKAAGVRDAQSPDVYRPIRKTPKHGGEWKSSKGVDELNLDPLNVVFNHGHVERVFSLDEVRERVNG